jgi:uncharacterized protein
VSADTSIDPERVAQIQAMLDTVEREENVRILLAVESGSRAWGFPSADSDYDVRFVYVHRLEWYLTIDPGRDVLERPLIDLIDLAGWDLKKALQLLRKSNPPLLEWLQCPIIYRERTPAAAALRGLLPRWFSPDASFYHYLHMARGNNREFLRGDVVRRKKYLYVLRPLLAMRWLEDGRGAVPIEFAQLLQAGVQNRHVRAAIDGLVEEKRRGFEQDAGPPIPEISDFIDAELARLEGISIGRRACAPDVEELNGVFRKAIHEAWSST